MDFEVEKNPPRYYLQQRGYAHLEVVFSLNQVSMLYYHKIFEKKGSHINISSVGYSFSDG